MLNGAADGQKAVTKNLCCCDEKRTFENASNVSFLLLLEDCNHEYHHIGGGL